MKNSDSIDKVFKIRCGAVFLSKTFFGGLSVQNSDSIDKVFKINCGGVGLLTTFLVGNVL